MIWTVFYIRLFWFWRWRMPFFDIAISSWEWHCPSLSPKWRASFLSVDYWLSRRETPHPPDFQVSPGWRTSPVELVNSFPADFLGKPERCPFFPLVSQDARSSWNRQLGQPEKPYPNKGVAKLGWLLGAIWWFFPWNPGVILFCCFTKGILYLYYST